MSIPFSEPQIQRHLIFRMSDHVTRVRSINIDDGVHHLQQAIDSSMKLHWASFTKEYALHYEQFRTDYIEPSVAFIDTQKRIADEKYNTLEKTHDEMKNKLQDVSRYNTLLLEKVDAIESELSSFSQVSMIAKFEKQCNAKTIECDRLQSRLDVMKSKYQQLQKENLSLNAKIEHMPVNVLRRVSECVQPEAITQDTCLPIPTESVSTHVSKSYSKLSVFTNAFSSTSAAQREETPDATEQRDTTPEIVSTEQNAMVVDNETPLTLLDGETCHVVVHHSHTQIVVGEDAEDSNVLLTDGERVDSVNPSHESFTHDDPIIITTPPTTLVDCDDTHTPVTEPIRIIECGTTPEIPEIVEESSSVACSDMDEPVSAISYIIKKLKRPKVDTVKQPYLFGSDKKLYTYVDDTTAGEEVGHQVEKNGKKMFKFHKK